jgi:hypothetical protein
MAADKLLLDLTLVLPDIPDEWDACVERLIVFGTGSRRRSAPQVSDLIEPDGVNIAPIHSWPRRERNHRRLRGYEVSQKVSRISRLVQGNNLPVVARR